VALLASAKRPGDLQWPGGRHQFRGAKASKLLRALVEATGFPDHLDP